TEPRLRCVFKQLRLYSVCRTVDSREAIRALPRVGGLVEERRWRPPTVWGQSDSDLDDKFSILTVPTRRARKADTCRTASPHCSPAINALPKFRRRSWMSASSCSRLYPRFARTGLVWGGGA